MPIDFEENTAATTHAEMLAWLAADLGLEPDQLVGYAIVLALRAGDGNNVQPAVRSNLGTTTACYLLSAAQADLLYLTVADPDHPDHGDICDAPREAHDNDEH